MSGKVVTLKKEQPQLQMVTLTPEMAINLLEANQHNRPLSDPHAQRIAAQIAGGKWKFNGDTIKVAENGDILDGQHRCWAVVYAKTAIETVIVRGIKADAFATIDTIRKPRSGADVLALHGAKRHGSVIAGAIGWLIRHQRGVIPTYRTRENKIENSDIEDYFVANPEVAASAEAASPLRNMKASTLLTFGHYLIGNRNPDLANAMIEGLRDPTKLPTTHPFFRFRVHLLGEQRRDPVATIALMFKAANAAAKDTQMQYLVWRSQGEHPEQFPVLDVTPS